MVDYRRDSFLVQVAAAWQTEWASVTQQTQYISQEMRHEVQCAHVMCVATRRVFLRISPADSRRMAKSGTAPSVYSSVQERREWNQGHPSHNTQLSLPGGRVPNWHC